MSRNQRAGRAMLSFWLAHGAIDATGAIDINKAAGLYQYDGRRLTKLEKRIGKRYADEASARSGKGRQSR